MAQWTFVCLSSSSQKCFSLSRAEVLKLFDWWLPWLIEPLAVTLPWSYNPVYTISCIYPVYTYIHTRSLWLLSWFPWLPRQPCHTVWEQLLQWLKNKKLYVRLNLGFLRRCGLRHPVSQLASFFLFLKYPVHTFHSTFPSKIANSPKIAFCHEMWVVFQHRCHVWCILNISRRLSLKSCTGIQKVS